MGESVIFDIMLVFNDQNTAQGETKRNHHPGRHFGRYSMDAWLIMDR